MVILKRCIITVDTVYYLFILLFCFLKPICNIFGLRNYLSRKVKNISGCKNPQEMVILIKGNINISCKFMENFIQSRALVLLICVILRMCVVLRMCIHAVHGVTTCQHVRYIFTRLMNNYME